MNINIIISTKRQNFNELVDVLCYSLKEIGHNIEYVQYIHEIDKLILSDINLYIGFPFGSQQNNLFIDQNRFNIYFCTEQYKINPMPFQIKLFNEKRPMFDAVLDMFKINIDVFNNTNTEYRYCPIGYSPIFEKNFNKNIKEDINIFHFGGKHLGNRKKYNNNIYFKECYYIEKDTYIQKAKYNLITSTYNNYELPQLRLMMILCLKKFPIVEKCIDYGPYKPNKHFILFDFKSDNFDDLEKLWDKKKKQNFIIEAYNDIKENHSMSMYLENALKTII